MEFYEIRFTTRDDNAKDATVRARGAAEAIDRSMKILGATVHRRPADHRDATAVMAIVYDADDADATIEEFAGAMAVNYGYPLDEYRAFGDSTLSLKNDADAIEEFVGDALDDSEFSIDLPSDDGANDDEETFTIGEDNE
ncbi:hypothetical protein [Halorussus halophilus]|uniref:hypothetical protein n=1 Tax=Halorussus halophilus TaxID=2650975 RepID=UPI0013015E9E|nr:hypothetical protein [Halorussus halophilus]